nr:hypothetical protein [Tanacetum cinerariifolium]
MNSIINAAMGWKSGGYLKNDSKRFKSFTIFGYTATPAMAVALWSFVATTEFLAKYLAVSSDAHTSPPSCTSLGFQALLEHIVLPEVRVGTNVGLTDWDIAAGWDTAVEIHDDCVLCDPLPDMTIVACPMIDTRCHPNEPQ